MTLGTQLTRRLHIWSLCATILIFNHAGMARAEDTSPLAVPSIWQVSTWALPVGDSPRDMRDSVVALSAHYQQITVAGSGPLADQLVADLQSRIGKDRVRATNEVTSPESMGSFIRGGKTDLLIHVTDTPPETWAADEETLVKTRDFVDLQSSVLSGYQVLRVMEGTMKDPNTSAHPLARKSVAMLQKALGDWSTSEGKDLLGGWDKMSDQADTILKRFEVGNAIAHDLGAAGEGKWTLADSQTLDQGIHWLADSGVAKVIKKLELVKEADVEGLPGALGFGELADGITTQIHSGHFTIDALEHYMDASVAVNWYMVGLMLSGDNVRVAKHVSEVAVAAAKAGRAVTAAPVKEVYDRYFGTEINDAFDQWQVEQISNARRGLPLVSWGDFSRQAGFTQAASSSKNDVADDLLHSCQRMEEVDNAKAGIAGGPRGTGSAPSKPVLTVGPELAAAALAEDWSNVVNQVGAILPQTVVPARMLAAHGYLALNRTNDALFLFGYTQDRTADLSAWLVWAQAFVQSHPDSAIAHYFNGDALARTKDLTAAAVEFDAGLKINPTNVLLLNARGVLFGLNGKLAEARASFEAAIKASNSKSADAFANIGYFWIQSQEGAEGAEQAFTQAISIAQANDSSFATAIHGRMCVRLVLKSAKAQEDLLEMYLPMTPQADDAMNENLRSYVARIAPANSSMADAIAKLQAPGMNLATSFENMRIHFDAAVLLSSNKDGISQLMGNTGQNDIARQLMKLPIDQQMAFRSTLTPPLQQALDARMNTINQWNGGVLHVTEISGNLFHAAGMALGVFGNSAPAKMWGLGAGVGEFASTLANQSATHMQAGAQQYLAQPRPIAPLPQNYAMPSIPAPPGVSHTIPGTPPGGVSFSFKEVHWDDGDWRFKPLYALLYPAPVTKTLPQ